MLQLVEPPKAHQVVQLESVDPCVVVPDWPPDPGSFWRPSRGDDEFRTLCKERERHSISFISSFMTSRVIYFSNVVCFLEVFSYFIRIRLMYLYSVIYIKIYIFGGAQFQFKHVWIVNYGQKKLSLRWFSLVFNILEDKIKIWFYDLEKRNRIRNCPACRRQIVLVFKRWNRSLFVCFPAVFCDSCGDAWERQACHSLVDLFLKSSRYFYRRCSRLLHLVLRMNLPTLDKINKSSNWPDCVPLLLLLQLLLNMVHL